MMNPYERGKADEKRGDQEIPSMKAKGGIVTAKRGGERKATAHWGEKAVERSKKWRGSQQVNK